MNAFFASVEQQANPFIRGKAIAVAGGKGKDRVYEGAAVLAASYPAKRLGIGLSTRLREARLLCPELIVVPLDALKYYSVNRRIVEIFRDSAPTVEIYSIDEAFLDVTDIVKNLDEAAILAKSISDRIKREVGECLTCSVGVSHNKLLAKVASDYKKPDAITVIPWEKRFEFLDSMKLEDIWGLGWHTVPKLKALGIKSTEGIREMDLTVLKSLVGSYAERLQMIARGEHYDRVNPHRSDRPQKSMQHAHTLSKPTTSEQELKALIRKLSERLAKRLRKHKQMAKVVSLGLRPARQTHYGWGYAPNYYDHIKLVEPSNNGLEIYQAACQVLSQKLNWNNEPIRLAVVGLAELDSTDSLMFNFNDEVSLKVVDTTMDQINNMFGEFTIRTGDILYEKSKDRELTVERENMTFHTDT